MRKVTNFLRRAVLMISLAQALDFEAEHAAFSTGTEMFRSAASGGFAVNLQPNESLMWSFTTESSCNVTVSTVRYSNDGDDDVVELQLDEHTVGSFTAIGFPQGGDRWNIFYNTSQAGNRSLPSGQHTLKLIVVTGDIQGVDIDLVTLSGSCVDGVPPTQVGDGITGLTDGDGITGPTDGAVGPIAGVIVGLVFVAVLVTVGISTIYVCYKRCHNQEMKTAGPSHPQVSCTIIQKLRIQICLNPVY